MAQWPFRCYMLTTFKCYMLIACLCANNTFICYVLTVSAKLPMSISFLGYFQQLS